MLVGRFGVCQKLRDLARTQTFSRFCLPSSFAEPHILVFSEKPVLTRYMVTNVPPERLPGDLSERPKSEKECSKVAYCCGTPSSLTLKSLLYKKIQRHRTGLPCKLRVLKYPYKQNQRTTRILCLLNDYQTWNEDVQTSIDVMDIKLSCKVVREVVKSLSNVEIAVGFFHWASQQEDFKHNTKTYSAIARLVGESGDLRLMHSLLHQMHKEGCPLTPYFLADIMMAYGKLNMVKEAFLVFKEMDSAGCPPNLFVYNCLISILTRAGYLEGAKKVYSMMWKVRDCRPDTVTYNMLIDNHGKTGDVLEAERYCLDMKQKGIRPNEKSYASLIGSLSKAGKIEKACDIFDRIKGTDRLINRVTYAELIRGLGKAGRYQSALEVFQQMKNAGCALDVVVYNIVLDLFVKQRMIAEAWKLFVSMQANQCVPNAVTYNSLLLGFCTSKRVDEAFRWYEQMKRDGIDPDNHTYTILISGLCKVGQWEAAYEFLMDVESSQGTKMNVAVHNAMLDGLVKAGELKTAFEHFCSIEKRGCVPDVFSYSIIIHGFGNVGKANDALDMYRKMKKTGLRPNLVTFNTLIDVLGKAEMIFEVHEIVEEMTALGYKPDVITYTSLLPVVSKNSRGFRRKKVSAAKYRFDHVLGIPLRSNT